MDSISSWLIITTGTCINQLAICWHSCDGLVQISTEFSFSVQKYFSIWEQSTIVLCVKTRYRVSICSLTLLGKTDSTHLFIYESLTISFPYTMVGLHSLLCSILFLFHLFSIPNPVSPPSPPPLFLHSSTSPLPFFHPPFLCFCSRKGKPPMWVNRAQHIRLKQDLAALVVLRQGKTSHHGQWGLQNMLKN